MERQLIAKWESRGGKYWAKLYKDNVNGHIAWSYDSDNGGGHSGISKDGIRYFLIYFGRKLRSGYFLPDNAKTPLRRVSL